MAWTALGGVRRLCSVWAASGGERVIVGMSVDCGSTRTVDDEGERWTCCSKLETEAATKLLESTLPAERLCL